MFRPLRPHPHPRDSRQLKVGQQLFSAWVQASSSPGLHLGGLWGHVLVLQTAGELGGCLGCPCPLSSGYSGSQGNIYPHWTKEIPLPWELTALCCPSGSPRFVTSPVFPKTLGGTRAHQRSSASFLGGKMKAQEASPPRGPAKSS